MSRRPELERRRIGAQATRDRFYGVRFDWASGMHCVKLAHAHLRNMGKRPHKLPKVTSPAEARKALKDRGWDSVSDMLDSMLDRVPPAMMRVGDIGVVEGDEGFESVVIYLGPRKVMGWVPGGAEIVIYDTGLDSLSAAWRV